MKNKIVMVLLTIFCIFDLNTNVFASDVFNGREVYTRECMACHGGAGEGSMPGLPNFQQDGTLYKNDNELMDIIRDGRGIMPSFIGLLRENDIRDVTAYLRTFL